MNFGIALIGTGNIAEEHARAINDVRGARLVGVLSHDAGRASEFARKYQCKGYRDLKGLLEDTEVAVVDIVNQNYLHADFALKCIHAGKHVIIEKPIDVNVKKAKMMVREAQKKNVAVTVISQYRFGRAYQKLKKMADNKEFGTLLMGVVVIGKSRGDKDYIGWRGRKKEAGGGVLMMNAVHYINILRWIFGDILEVKGEVSTLTHNIGVEDAGGVLIKFKNGAIGIIAATTSLPFNIADRVEVYGSKCSLIIEGGRITKSYRKNRAYSTLSSNLDKLRLTRNGKIQEQITNFISFLNGKEKLEINGEEGVKDLEIIEKIYKES